MTLSANCLICYKPTESNHINDNNVANASEENNKDHLLNNQLLTVFLLRKLLGVSLSFCEYLLVELGDPSEWIICCETCSTLIHDTFAVHNDLLKLISKSKSLRKQVKEKLNKSGADCVTKDGISETSTTPASTKSKIIDEIRNYYFFGNPNTQSSNIFKSEKSGDSDRDDSDDCNRSESNYSEDSELSNPMKVELDPADFILNEFSEDCTKAIVPDDISNVNTDFANAFKSEPSEEKVSDLSDSGDCIIPEPHYSEVCEPSSPIKVEVDPADFIFNDGFEDSETEIVPDITKFQCKESIIIPDEIESNLSETVKNEETRDSMSEKRKPLILRKFTSPIPILQQPSSYPKRQLLVDPAASAPSRKQKLIPVTPILSTKLNLGSLQLITILPTNPTNTANVDLQGGTSAEIATQGGPSSGTLTCPFCDKEFSSLTELESHKNRKHYKEEELPRECEECNISFKTFANFMDHNRIYHKKVKKVAPEGQESFKCNLCDKECSSASKLYSHRRAEHLEEFNWKSFQCKECGKTLSSGKQLRFHITAMHTHDFDVFCPICNKGFVEQKVLDRHIQAHNKEKPHLCAFCGKAFAGKHTLRAHEITEHTHQYKCECTVCGKKFARQQELRQHSMKHHPQLLKPFVCEICASSFYQKCDLLNHQRGFHYEELNLEPLKCSECDMVFSTTDKLNYHRKSKHKGDDFTCEECGRTFISESVMSNHIRRNHKKERLFKCTTCDRAFFNGTELKRHTERHTKDYRFKCTLCPKGGSTKRNFERHMKTHSKNQDDVDSDESDNN